MYNTPIEYTSIITSRSGLEWNGRPRQEIKIQQNSK